MTDHPKDPPPESPMQRALRLRKAALASNPRGADGATFNPRRSSKMAAGASKPWMKK